MSKTSDLQESRTTVLELSDRLDDFMAGFRFWKEHKIAGLEWDTVDEMFARWVERSE